MAVVMIMEWPGVTLEQYEAVRRTTRFEEDIPPGGIFHVAAHDGSGLRVTDVWETADDFNRFRDNRLMPAVQQAGITTEPKVEVYPTYNIFAPGYSAK